MTNKKEIKSNINPNTKKILNESFFGISVNDNESNTKENNDIINLLDNYTRLKEKSIMKVIINLYLGKKINISFNDIIYNEDKKMYEFHSKDGRIITFDMLSNYVPDKELFNELNSKKRYKKCHERSFELSDFIKNSNILTGYIIINNHKILHSVVEITEDDVPYILDWTNNIKMAKEDYINLYKFQVLQKVNSNDLESDRNLLETAGIDSLKTYLVFRDEIIRDLEKNIQIFNTIDKKITKR